MPLSLNIERRKLKLILAELFRVVELAQARYSINRSTLYNLQGVQGLKNNAGKRIAYIPILSALVFFFNLCFFNI